MVQSVLLFSLGFLSAAFLALMVAPAIWGRAVALTKKRIEASLPMSLNEVQADKDQLRAEFALSTRRLELSVKTFKEKIAHQMAEIAKNREELVRLSTERDDKNLGLTQVEEETAQLRSEMKKQKETLVALKKEQADAQTLLEKKTKELQRLNFQMQDVSEIADSRKIELVARDTEIGTLSDKLSEHRREQKDLRHYSREMEIEIKQAQESLKQERKRYAEAEKKIERLMSQLSDREEKLDRREKEFARLREQLKSTSADTHNIDERLTAADKVRVDLEVQIAELGAKLASATNAPAIADTENVVRKLQDERDSLKKRVAILSSDKKNVEDELAQGHLAIASDWTGERHDMAVLREQINDIAAEVVQMTAALEGPGSPVLSALNSNTKKSVSTNTSGVRAPLSLADRVKALQKAATARK